MAEEPNDGGKTGAFFLGMLVGMLLCLAAGGVFYATVLQRQAVATREATMMAEMARAEALAREASARKAADAERYARQLNEAQRATLEGGPRMQEGKAAKQPVPPMQPAKE